MPAYHRPCSTAERCEDLLCTEALSWTGQQRLGKKGQVQTRRFRPTGRAGQQKKRRSLLLLPTGSVAHFIPVTSVPRSCCKGCTDKQFSRKKYDYESPDLTALRRNCCTLIPWQLLLVGRGVGGWKLIDVASHLSKSESGF